MARYSYYKIVYIGGKKDNICNNIYKGLDIIRVINYKLEDLIMPLKPARVKISIRKGRSFSRGRLAILIPYYRPVSVRVWAFCLKVEGAL